MITIPFIYFSILLFLIIHKNKAFDVSAAIVAIFVISSFFSILIDVFNLYSDTVPETEIHILPTVSYCFFHSLLIYPFYRWKSYKINKIILLQKNRKLFDYFVYFYFGIFVILLLLYYKDIVFRLFFGDFSQLRKEMQKGILLTSQYHFSGFKKIISIFVGVFAEGSLIMIMFYFYSITFLRKSKSFNLLILLGSLSVIVIGIIGLDRSKTFYYILVFYLMFIFFKPYMNKRQQVQVMRVIIIFGSLILTYFMAVTISRFGSRYTGTQGGIISYAGQSFINFCNFFDNLHIEKYSFKRVFPLFHHIFSGNKYEYDNYYSGINVGVFATYLGMFILEIGKVGAILFSLIFYFISRIFLKRKRLNYIAFYQMIIFFILVLVPLLGFISYYYTNFSRSICAITFILLSVFFKYKKV